MTVMTDSERTNVVNPLCKRLWSLTSGTARCCWVFFFFLATSRDMEVVTSCAMFKGVTW